MTTLSADERIANAIWRVIGNPARIYSKHQIREALIANGITRSMYTLFNIGVRRLLEDKAEAKGLALVIERSCVYVTTQEWDILHKTVRMLRYYQTLGESVGHEGRGINQLRSSATPVARDMADLATAAGVNGRLLRAALASADEVLATTFEAGRDAANTAFARARARTQ